jgi:hypothetical protein
MLEPLDRPIPIHVLASDEVDSFLAGLGERERRFALAQVFQRGKQAATFSCPMRLATSPPYCLA